MSLTEMLFIIAAILVVVDFFITTDIPTHIAYVIIVVNIIRHPDIHFLYKILFGLLLWFALVAFHYLVWRGLVLRFTNRFIAPDRHLDGARGRIGMNGTICCRNGSIFVSVQGDLWKAKSGTSERLEDNDPVEIIDADNEIMTVRKLNKE